MSILTLENIHYAYPGAKKEVLRGVDCQFYTGKLYALIGKSGSGKSTLLSLMGGLDLPTEGAVLFQGSSVSKMDLDRYRRENTAVIYQDYGLFPLLTVLENIMYPMELCRVPREKAKADAQILARKALLPDSLWHRYPGQLSGGEQQRVAIARALAMDRHLLLADEPTGNLDSENSDKIMDLLLRLAHEDQRCVIVVTHDIAAMEKADVVYRMVDGRLVQMDK